MSDANKNNQKPNDPNNTQPPAPVTPPANEPPVTPPAPSLTQADIDNAVAKAKSDWEKEQKEKEDQAAMSESERQAAQIAKLTRENLMMKAESDVVQALTAAGAKEAALMFAAKKDSLEFKDDKVSNIAQIIEDCKKSHPSLFGEEKPKEGIDAGAGNKQDPKTRAENLNSALKNYYKK